MDSDIHERSPIRALAEALDGGLKPGEIGLIAARPGIGKSALLVHFALDALLRDQAVLHVSLRETVDHVRSYYDEIIGAVARTGRIRDRHQALVTAERHRMIHSYLDKHFDVAHLAQNLDMLKEIAHFEPRLLVLDGFEVADLSARLADVARLARDRGLPVWLTVRVGAEEALDAGLWDHVRGGFTLTPMGSAVDVRFLDASGERDLPYRLDPTTMLVVGEGVSDPASSHPRLRSADCTLYSGGANGAEAAFGEECERWGVHEVNFTFDGHKQSRTRGRYVLSPRELAAGDVSLVYVSRRLNRTYSEGTLIRKVLQTLWHMVSRSQQVFIIGTIQEDGTVVGGTGWSVELARMWNKTLWVFDQEKNGWYHWSGDDWTPGTPVIDAVHFTGAGTRYLSDTGRAAIADLFRRSFGA